MKNSLPMPRPVLAAVAIATTSLLFAQSQASNPADPRIESALARMTLKEKLDLLNGVDSFYLRAVPSAGLPRLRMADGPMGVRNDGPSTTTGGISLAATWNRDLARRVGQQIGRDARARGVHFLLGPGVNMYVAPMNGRNFEYFGEDPLLAGRMAASWIDGVQSQGVSATVKHFMGNNSEFDRHNVDAIIDERTMREIYLPAFETAVKTGHVGAIMDSYNLVNGQHATQNAHLNNDIVKNGWKFDGLIMSDWYATYDGVGAANGGMDVEMPSGLFMNERTIVKALESGEVKMATIDDKVRRILRSTARFSWAERGQSDLAISRFNPAGDDVALRTAEEGMVLLRNQINLLPIAKNTRTIAVIGPDAFPAVPTGGGSAAAKPFTAVSYLEGLKTAAGGNTSVLYHRGTRDWATLANATSFTLDEAGKQPGVKVELYSSKEFTGSPISTHTFDHIFLKPAVSVTDLLAGTDPSTVDQKPGSSTRWTGYYTAPKTGAYQVFARSPMDGSGGTRLFIDGKLITDDWIVRKSVVAQARVELAAGPHKVVFERHQEARNFLGDLIQVGIIPEGTFVDADAKAIAAKADLVVLAVGYDSESETEGGDRTFALPTGQDELIREIAAMNPKTVVVITSGGNVDMNSWLDRVGAVIEAWYPGQQGGTALAEILYGDVNPSGRLPATFEKRWEDNPAHDSYYPDPGTSRVVYRNGIFSGYRGYEHNSTTPQFPFGFGLSYTTFRYSDLKITPLPGDANFEVSFNITNSGSRVGADVPQVYVSDTHASVPRPPKELKGFAKVTLRPGETTTVKIALDSRSFSYFDTKANDWLAEPGAFEILVGKSSAQIELRDTVRLNASVRTPVSK